MIQGCVRIMPVVRICGSSDIDAIRLYVHTTFLMVFTCTAAVWRINIGFYKEVK
jgi:hypothetical protein